MKYSLHCYSTLGVWYVKLLVFHFYNWDTKAYRGLRDNNTAILGKTVFLIKSHFSKV